MAEFAFLSATLLAFGLSIILFGLLTWRIWVKPGPIKIGIMLAIQVLALISTAARMNYDTLWSVGWGLVWVDIEIVALRGALAMKRLKDSRPEEVF
jgi:hypothetical protein